MRHTVDYYLAPQSPWTYLGHERFAALARATADRSIAPTSIACWRRTPDSTS